MSATLTSLRVLVCRSVGAGVYVREINKARQGCPEGKELLKGEGRLRMRAAEPDERMRRKGGDTSGKCWR